MAELSMAEVESLWAEGRRIPVDLAPIALWHLFDPQPPTEDKFMPGSEEALGEAF